MNKETEKTETRDIPTTEHSQTRDIPTTEQCFYASFKIYLSDSRTNSICELDDSDCVQSEVVRIEKTLEVVDVTESEEEKTLSISPVFKYPHTEDHTEDDTDVDLEDVDIEHFCYKPKLIITNSERVLKRSVSECDDSPPERQSRCPEKLSNRRYEATQSMDRANTDRSPVFYLDPLDWIRTGEGERSVSPHSAHHYRGILSAASQGEGAGQGVGWAGREVPGHPDRVRGESQH